MCVLNNIIYNNLFSFMASKATSNLPYTQRLNIVCIRINWQGAEQ